MRDAAPTRRGAVGVLDHPPRVLVQEPRVDLVQTVHGERVAPLGTLVGFLLELREHHLRVHRALDLADVMVQEEDPLLPVHLLPQQVIHQDGLVRRGGHLGHEDRVVRVDHRLIRHRVVRVQGVTHLVRQREHAVDVVFVVHQHVRVRDGGRPPGVGAAALARVLVHVHPARAEPLRHVRHVLRTEGIETGDDRLHGLLVGDVLVELRDE